MIEGQELEDLVAKLVPLVGARLKPQGQGVGVKVARMHRMQGSAVLCYVDLSFTWNGADLFVVPGFKFIKKDGGARWLAVPQRKSETPNADGTDKWLDTFTWASGPLKDMARDVVKAHYDKGEPVDA